MNDSFRIAQKVGLMFRPEDEIPRDIKSWAKEQLYLKTGPVGIERVGQDVSPWPKSLSSSLRQRVIKLQKDRKTKDQTSTDNSLSADERRRKLKDLNKTGKYLTAEIDQHRFAHRNVYGMDQVRQRFALFWFNHFTIGDKETTFGLMGHYFEEAIINNMNSDFNEMLYRVTSHPAMLTYLDNIYNTGENSKYSKECRGRKDCFRGNNDNLARELMELHTVSTAAGYTEKDINAVARVLAGWGQIVDKKEEEKKRKISDHWNSYSKRFAEPGSKVVLGKTIYHGHSGLRNLTNHLASLNYTIEHLSSKLCSHFVSDNPSKADINYVMKAWERSKGNLDKVHEAVIERAIKSKDSKFQWPINWLFQVIRLSGATFFDGWEANTKMVKNDLMKARNIFDELGQSFWSDRQPDGFSNNKSEWVSVELLERRLRFADSIYNIGKPTLTTDEIMKRVGANSHTRSLVASVSNPRKKFIALMCSPEIMGLSNE